jgi:hypothetical protein
MSCEADGSIQVYKVTDQHGRWYVVYNAAAIGNPPNHRPDKWYARPFPIILPVVGGPGQPFETAADAEQAARAGLDGEPARGCAGPDDVEGRGTGPAQRTAPPGR